MKKSASGSGRGRGWMKLNNKTEHERPGGTPSNNLVNSVTKLNIDQNEYKKNCDIPQFAKLINIFEQIDAKDDGILLNQKLKHLIKVWREDCKSATDINKSFTCVYSKCLQDSSFATKLVTVMASRTFISQKIHEIKIRHIFVGSLQQDYENRVSIQQESPAAFRNFVRMLGEFCHKARLADGSSLKLLNKPILDCLEMLVKNAQPADLDLFTTMLYLNGSSFDSAQLEAMSLLLMQVRQLLVHGTSLTKTCRTWLLLALDVANNRFGILPSDIHKFYEEQLGEKAIAHFQGTHNILSIETSYPSKTLDSYQSSVSVLQVTPPESTSPVEQSNIVYNNCQPQAEGRRIGRPILGVGARSHSNGEQEEWYDRRK
ncbi:hypothetical protein RN001_000442 [Aquatica leii]|uniref:Uncharacterized protein n=1 Tax=Aquatica leii TaxID=1421715 RepID=A0AAN7PK50_9COLE|nr:hypothetical protein RN001_000442 [Aquatica leii]